MASPQIQIYIATSLDSFIATADGGVDWLEPFQAEDLGYSAFVATIGTIVMGRTTYEQIRGFGSWPYAGKRTVILSSRAIGSPPENTEVSDDGIQALVSRLKALGEDVWIVGGAKTIRAFLDHDAVDRMELFVIPVLIGSGLPLFERSPRHARLSLEETQSFPCGVVRLVYRFA